MTRVYLFVFALFIVASALDVNSNSGEDCDDSDGDGGKSRGGDTRRCPPGWKLFKRKRGPWCIRVVPSYGVTFNVCSNVCNDEGGVLSGIENDKESSWIIATGNRIFYVESGSLWIGARRTANCLGQGMSQSCSQTTAFEWTDESTSGTAGFKWISSNVPDNSSGYLGGPVQDCVHMIIARRNVTISNGVWFPGSMDDVGCVDTGVNEPRRIQGCVCGRRPT